MNQSDIQFRNEQNQAETELEFLARLIFSLRALQEENNINEARIAGQLIDSDQKRSEENLKLEEHQEVHTSLLSYILQEIRTKDVDLSEVVAGLEIIRREIAASRQETKDTEPMDEARNGRILNALHELSELTQANKPETIDLSPVVNAETEGHKKTQQILSALLAEISLLDIKPEITIPDKVEVKEPKWYKPFTWEAKWLEPIEKAIDKINPKKGLDKIADLAEKILARPHLKLPVNKDGRIQVEVDRTGGSGGGSGVIDSSGNPINPATEQTLQDVKTAVVGDYNLLYEQTGNYVYVGQSTGTDGSQAIWRIKRLDSLNGKLYFADNVKTFTKVWADRATFTY